MAEASYSVSAPVTVVDPADPTAVAIARLMEQYKTQPKIVALLQSFLTQCAELEVKLGELETERYLDTAVGAQLDGLGDILGQDRLGLNDEDYRQLLRARVLVNASRGTANEIIEIFQLITEPGAVINLQEIFPATVELELSQPSLPNTALYRSLLAEAVATSIGSTFIWLPLEPFSFSVEPAPPGDPNPYTPTIDPVLGFGESATPTSGGFFASA